MIRLMIVDDEQIIRMGIKNSIPWKEHDIEVTGDAANGEEAFKLALKCNPDIMLTDIRMPRMDGITLIKKLKEAGLQTKVIVLTAYNETSYYAQVIPLGIENFVLKNACADTILSEVLNVAKKISKEREIRVRTENHEKLLAENMYVIQSSYMSGIFSGRETPDNWAEKQQKLELSLPGPTFAVLAMAVRKSDWWRIISLTEQMLHTLMPFAFQYKEDVFAVILNFSEGTECRHLVKEFMQNIGGYCLQNRLIALMPVKSFDDLFGTGSLIESALDRCCWIQSDDDRFLSPAAEPGSFLLGEALKHEKSMLTSIGSENRQHCLETWYHYMRTIGAPYYALQESACRICVILGSVSHQMDKASEIMGKIRLEESAENIFADLVILLKPQTGGAAEKSQVGAALAYMEKNYSQNLTIADVAKSVYMSSNYLSKIFRKETGYSFKETINQIRIRKAKELLKNTSLRHYEIAEKIGYSDYKKFSEYFHKYTGCSAKEYRLKFCTETMDFDDKLQ